MCRVFTGHSGTFLKQSHSLITAPTISQIPTCFLFFSPSSINFLSSVNPPSIPHSPLLFLFLSVSAFFTQTHVYAFPQPLISPLYPYPSRWYFYNRSSLSHRSVFVHTNTQLSFCQSPSPSPFFLSPPPPLPTSPIFPVFLMSCYLCSFLPFFFRQPNPSHPYYAIFFLYFHMFLSVPQRILLFFFLFVLFWVFSRSSRLAVCGISTRPDRGVSVLDHQI